MRFPSLLHTSLFSSFFLPSSLSLFNFVYFIYFFSPFLLYTYINSTGSKLIFMQIRAFKARGFFVHWFTPVYTRLKHGYVDFSPRNPRRSLPAYVSLNQPRDIDSISTNTASLPFIDIAHDLSAWFSPSFFFLFSLFLFLFFLYDTYLCYWDWDRTTKGGCCQSGFQVVHTVTCNCCTKLNLFCLESDWLIDWRLM